MKITLDRTHGLELIYIYMINSPEVVDFTVADVLCELLFNKQNEWVGIYLPSIISQNDTVPLTIEFNNDKDILFINGIQVSHTKRVRANLDFLAGSLYGVELLLRDGDTGNRNIVDHMVEYY